MYSSGVFDLIVWLVVVEGLAFALLPIFAWMAREAPDRGYGLTKIGGAFLYGLVCWIVPATGLFAASRTLLTIVFGLMLLGGYQLWIAGPIALAELKAVLRRHVYAVEGIFLGLTALFALIRFLNPEIFWGEKPMDATFLNFFIRNESLPPQDPWAAGSPMHYYYVGIYIVAALLKLTGIPAAIGFNVAISTLAGFIGAGLYSLISILTRAPRFAAIAAPLVVTATDPEVLNLVFIDGRGSNFDTFWASTRVFTSPSFFEYTSWSLLFADLHAHVVAIPVTVLLLALGALLFVDVKGRFTGGGVVLRILLGATWGALYGMNTWDFISFGFVLGCLILLSPSQRFWEPPVRYDGTVALRERVFASVFPRVVAIAWDVVPIFFGVLATALPYAIGTGAGTEVGWGWAAQEEFNTAGQLLRMLGYLIALFSVGLGVLVARNFSIILTTSKRLIGTFAVLIVVSSLTWLSSLFHGVTGLPWGIIAISNALLLLSFIATFCTGNSNELKVAGLFSCCGAFLISVLEIFFLIDRMNTLFKGYMAVWILLAVGATTILFFAWQSIRNIAGEGVRWSIATVVGGVVALSSTGFLLNSVAIAKLQRVPKRFFTLDGNAYIAASDPEDYRVIHWFNSTINGTPTILEAQGESYRDFTRIAMHTGLPTVLGWEHHVSQRGLSPIALEERRRAVRDIYSARDMANIPPLLLRYGVQFIVVGDLERRTYPAAGLAKFDHHPEIFTPVFSAGATKVYVTYFSTFNERLKGLVRP